MERGEARVVVQNHFVQHAEQIGLYLTGEEKSWKDYNQENVITALHFRNIYQESRGWVEGWGMSKTVTGSYSASVGTEKTKDRAVRVEILE